MCEKPIPPRKGRKPIIWRQFTNYRHKKHGKGRLSPRAEAITTRGQAGQTSRRNASGIKDFGDNIVP